MMSGRRKGQSKLNPSTSHFHVHAPNFRAISLDIHRHPQNSSTVGVVLRESPDTTSELSVLQYLANDDDHIVHLTGYRNWDQLLAEGDSAMRGSQPLQANYKAEVRMVVGSLQLRPAGSSWLSATLSLAQRVSSSSIVDILVYPLCS